jgi:hypothetical protein
MTGACSVGGILLQPQRVPRLAGAGDELLMDVLLSMAIRIAADQAAGHWSEAAGARRRRHAHCGRAPA